MKLEDQVPSRELCQKLEKLGYPQEGLFQHIEGGNITPNKTCYHKEKTSYWEVCLCVAPTVAEMGEWLPDAYKSRRYSGKYYAEQYEDDFDLCEGSSTEANARAKLLIYLAENNLIKFKK